ncbi:unnamed protein product [Dovyalis caffra]|uniref:Uncharacterized protein n=1 Tax=Dovyalis caffra TaxID=77055 RepID=A0AAV1R5P7_9ROSI|nr:unnamed protein product [Dovyalis caffra]
MGIEVRNSKAVSYSYSLALQPLLVSRISVSGHRNPNDQSGGIKHNKDKCIEIDADHRNRPSLTPILLRIDELEPGGLGSDRGVESGEEE